MATLTTKSIPSMPIPFEDLKRYDLPSSKDGRLSLSELSRMPGEDIARVFKYGVRAAHTGDKPATREQVVGLLLKLPDNKVAEVLVQSEFLDKGEYLSVLLAHDPKKVVAVAKQLAATEAEDPEEKGVALHDCYKALPAEKRDEFLALIKKNAPALEVQLVAAAERARIARYRR